MSIGETSHNFSCVVFLIIQANELIPRLRAAAICKCHNLKKTFSVNIQHWFQINVL